ncbi:MAG: T9SS type A sorting domain-containing protein [Chitinophagaceae bacterium]|nr:MAG: T9SS type A sorting domain-containing protein [Chitinophagaceae bacterium]
MRINFYPHFRVCLIAILSSLLFCSKSASAQQFLTQIDGWNAYVHLPDDYYDSVGKRYPLICFIPGTGECGTDPSRLLTYGPSKYIAEGHNMQFTVNGKLEKPIVISLQPVNLWPGASTINRKLDSIFARYRCDLQRINATGLSMGGWSWDNFVDNYSPVYTNKITSIVSMSAPPPDNGYGNMKHFALAGGTMWAFEGNNDLRGLDQIRDTMNRAVPSSARYTLYNGGHCCWNTFYNPGFTENGESVYTWMLKQKKALVQGNTVSPEANAGRDSATVSIVTTVPLKGNGNDPNGLPINFNWVKIAGPATGSIANSAAMQTTVSGLSMGEYKFELRVTNAIGLIGKDTVTIRNGVVVLPVVLEQFFAKLNANGTVQLDWKTSTEVNAAHFIIERSSNGQSYTQVARLTASGIAGAAYSSIDYLPAQGLNFYRLKMVDMDGRFEYSKIVNINATSTRGASIAIASAFGTAGRLNLNLSSNESKPATLAIVDAAGKLLSSTKLSLNSGMNLIAKNVSLPAGVYYVSLTTELEKVTKTIIYK